MKINNARMRFSRKSMTWSALPGPQLRDWCMCACARCPHPRRSNRSTTSGPHHTALLSPAWRPPSAHRVVYAPEPSPRPHRGDRGPHGKPDNRNTAAPAGPPPQGFDRTPDRITSCQEPRTLGAATLLPGVFTPMGMLDSCLSQATGERLAQVPHRLGHLR